jgi:ATP-binding cassette subfamily F protein 3
VIQLTSAGKRFGEKLLFENATWQINPGDRIGLVGANGTGKTTLLRILRGELTLDDGALSSTKGTSTGYLPQHGLEFSGRTVFGECLAVFEYLRAAEVELEALTRQISRLDPSGAEYAEVAERFHRLEHEFRTLDGYALEAQVGTVLGGLGFPKEDWTRRVEEFSGGWQMRLALAKLLLEKPNLLLLDEPTNHLDLEARNWLEEYLRSYPYAFVLVSHDRYFLDVTVHKVVEIWNRGLYFYSGNYSRYLELKIERRAQIEAACKNQQDRIRQLEAFINRFRYQAAKAKQVQSRVKELDRIQRIELPPEEEKAIHFSFPQPKASGRVVAEFRDVTKRYGFKQVFDCVTFLIERGDRIALVGANGAGKSTLIRMLAGIEPLTSGQYKLGHNVEPDYFAQDQYKELDPAVRILDDLWALAPSSTETEMRGLLGSFLFSEADVFKPVGVLSGGERNRYALARLLLRPSNFLLLDEPTNHLDLRAKDVLLDSLQEFSGTLVFVSHDRYFIDKLATRVFEIGEGQVRVYPGNYEDYLWRKAAQSEAAQAPSPAAEAQPGKAADDAAAGRGPAPHRVNPIRLRQMRERLKALEADVARLEAEIAHIERELAVFKNAEETVRQSELLQARRGELEAGLAEWEELSRAIEDAGGA